MEASRFLDSSVPEPEFSALGHAGSLYYKGLETFDNPGCQVVTLAFDELMCKCPITGQPDWYAGEINLIATEKLIESKSLKLFFQNIIEGTWTKDVGMFGEALAVFVRDQIAIALGYTVLSEEPHVDLEEAREHIRVKLTQKSRGGISITAIA